MKHKLKAKIYTDSLFNISSKMKINKEVNDSLLLIAFYFKKDSTFRYFLLTRRIRGDEKSLILTKIFKKKCHPLVSQMLGILSDKKELFLLNNIIKNFVKKNKTLNKILIINAYLSIKLNLDEEKNIKSKMEQFFKRTTNLTFNIAPEIIGGMKLRIGNYFIDGSIQGQLKKLKDQLN